MESVSEGRDEQQPELPSSLESGGESVQKAAIRDMQKQKSPNFIGKHRMAAAVAQLHQQIQIIQEEMEELETLGESCIVCKELVSTVESVPDALLPVTKGPAVTGWDRWFQGANGSSSRKRWI